MGIAAIFAGPTALIRMVHSISGDAATTKLLVAPFTIALPVAFLEG